MKINFRILVSGLALLLVTTEVYADYDVRQLKKLFTTVQQRKHIDDMRHGKVMQLHKEKKTDRVIVSGYVKRSDGKNVVWVNGKNTLTGNSIHGIKVDPESINDLGQVILSIDGKQLKLKPGQSWSRRRTGVAARHPGH